MLDLAPSLTPVTVGRLFCRDAARAGATIGRAPKNPAVIVGVVDVPRSIELERVITARLNSSLWLDLSNSRRPTDQFGGPLSHLAEHDVGSLLTASGWHPGALPDTLELFVRATHLEHEDRSRRWVYVAGLAATRPAVMPQDGIYELCAGEEPRLVHASTFNGMGAHMPLREPFWGPGGNFALATSMDPAFYSEWVVRDRARNARQDPYFAAFIERMEREMPSKLVYTREEREAREQLSKRVILEIMAEPAEEDSSASAAHAVRPASRS